MRKKNLLPAAAAVLLTCGLVLSACSSGGAKEPENRLRICRNDLCGSHGHGCIRGCRGRRNRRSRAINGYFCR